MLVQTATGSRLLFMQKAAVGLVVVLVLPRRIYTDSVGTAAARLGWGLLPSAGIQMIPKTHWLDLATV